MRTILTAAVTSPCIGRRVRDDEESEADDESDGAGPAASGGGGDGTSGPARGGAVQAVRRAVAADRRR